jgi:hypothetical protein
MHLVDIFSCLLVCAFINGAVLLTVVQPSLPCCMNGPVWVAGPGYCTVHNVSSVYNLKKRSREIIFLPHFQWRAAQVSLNIYWRNSVGSTDIYSGKIQCCLYGSCAWTNKNVCRLKQHTVQVSLYMVSYPQNWNCWNSTHSESWAMDSGKCWACCRRRVHSAVWSRHWIGPEPVWR